MNKKLTIIIKNSRLQKIRSNLRSLILEASKSIQHKLMDEIEVLPADVGEYFNNPILIEQHKELRKKKQLIEQQVDVSIVFCPICFKSNKDMTYSPIVKKWYCIECYEKLKKGYSDDGEPNRFP